MFLTSKRLRLRTRILMLLAMWIPAVNLLVLLHAMRLVHEEYDFECYKESVRRVRAESDLCGTKYPLLLVHGVGFRISGISITGEGSQGTCKVWGISVLRQPGGVCHSGLNAGDIRKR